MANGLLPGVFQAQAFKLVSKPGALLYSYLSGSSTPQAVYLDIALNTAASNPLVADASGIFPTFWLAQVTYRFFITDANGTTLLAATDGIGGQIALANIASASAASRLLGRGSAAGAGVWQEITIGTGLSMSGTALGMSVPGSDTQVIFNDGGAFGADAGLTYNKTTDALTLAGLLNIAGAAAGQIQFPATQNASSNANTFDDYEEGTWTATDASGAGLSFSSVEGQYVKMGSLVIAAFTATYPATVDASAARIGGLPYAAFSTTNSIWGGGVVYTNSSQAFFYNVNLGTTQALPYKTDGTQPTNANMTGAVVRAVLVYRASA